MVAERMADLDAEQAGNDVTFDQDHSQRICEIGELRGEPVIDVGMDHDRHGLRRDQAKCPHG